jgi:signal transduction histidine kinase
MYMAINMMGHVYNYSGDKASAKQCFWEVIRRMEQEGYRESQPPIYMNLVNILMDENPQEALRLIDQAASIAQETSPERLFDIETRRTLAYYLMGDKQRFLEGYQAYREGVAKGYSSVHGRSLEVYYQATLGNIDEAIRLAGESSEDPHETQAEIFAGAGRWQEAFEALKKGTAETDSINSLLLSSSMQGIQNELKAYETERQAFRRWVYALAFIIILLLLLALAFVYIVQMRRRHWREMEKAYQRVLESDKMKTAFIQNVSHEVRTPLNIISGYAQVIADPDYDITPYERKRMANTMMDNTHVITTMIDEVLEISLSESAGLEHDLTSYPCNDLLRRLLEEFKKMVSDSPITIQYESALDDQFTISTNEGIMRRIIHPLLDNAVKNTTAGQVTLRCSSTPDNLVIQVEDTGRGIPANQAEHIFERFVKLDSFKEGMGLGLTFSRAMTTRLGGNVRLDTSYAGPGARFEVTIPLVHQQ